MSSQMNNLPGRFLAALVKLTNSFLQNPTLEAVEDLEILAAGGHPEQTSDIRREWEESNRGLRPEIVDALTKAKVTIAEVEMCNSRAELKELFRNKKVPLDSINDLTKIWRIINKRK